MTKYDSLYSDFNNIRDMVISYFDVRKDDLLNSNKENIVDARYCLIGILCDKYKDSEIAKVSCLSKSVINKIRNQINTNSRNKSFYFDFNRVKSLVVLS